MTDPASQDDGWDELARELGLEKPSPIEERHPTSEPVAQPQHDTEAISAAADQPAESHYLSAEPVIEEAELFDAESDPVGAEAEFELEDGEGEPGEGDSAGGEGLGEDGQPGTGRKRRRRRRRRKKGAQPSGTVAGDPAEAAGIDVVEDEPSHSTPVQAQLPPIVAEEEEVFESSEEDRSEEESGAFPGTAEEDTGGEVLRELIATWNVPSWDEIVSSLYRPDR
jgi:ribonuclease E